MAFTTTQRMDNALMRNLTFRTPLNIPISSQYTLYANGQGQTYWSNSVSPSDLSTVYTSLSTSIHTLESSTTSSINMLNSTLTSSITFLSTYIGIQGQQMNSSYTQLIQNDASLSNSVFILSNNIQGLAYSNAVQINAIYTSTIIEVTNTLNSYSNLSTFYLETSNLLNVIATSASTLSTTIGLQNTSTYDSLTSNYILYANGLFTTAAVNLGLYSNYAESTFSFNQSTQSSIVGLDSNTSTATFQLNSSINAQSTLTGSTIDNLYISSIYPINSTLSSYGIRISTLESQSTSLYSTSYMWISTFVSTSQGYQNIDIQSSITSLLDTQSSMLVSTSVFISTFGTLSSILISSIEYNNSTVKSLESQVSTLTIAYSVLTTSSILLDIYDSFVNLEVYTSTILINALWSNDLVFKSTLIASTTTIVSTTALAYFNYYVSTMYESTLSTLIPSTQAYYSSIVSTTTWYTISTTTSSMIGISNESATAYYSTTSSLTKILLDSTTTQLNSSITGNLIIPTQILLSSFSTIFGTNINTYSSVFGTQITSQSTTFNSFYSWASTSYSTIYTSSMNQMLFMSTQTGVNNSTAYAQLSTQSTMFSRQLSTQTLQFNSTLAAMGITFASTLTSTNNALFFQTSVTAASTLNNIQYSTLQTYSNFVTSLVNASSTITLSSLFTEQVLDLTGASSNAVMDLATYRNFNVNVYNIMSSNAMYRLSYSSNTLLGLNYRTGFIFINVSTVGQTYTSNSSQLRFEVYQWGLPTTVYGAIYPYISNADYTLQYQYVIQNNRMYTNLMNVYPRIRVQNISYTSILSNVMNFNNVNDPPFNNVFWRGSPVLVNWSNYSFFPSSLGAPPFNPQVLLDVRINNSTVAEYGPYSFDTTSAIINAPYLSGIVSCNIFETQVRAYIAGAVNEAAITNFFTLMPTFDQIILRAPPLQNTVYVGGTEIAAVTDVGGYPLYSTNITMTSVSGQISYNNTSNFIPQNVNNGLINRVGAFGNNSVSLNYSTSMVTSLSGLVLEPESLQSWNSVRTTNVSVTPTQISKTTADSAWNATAYATDGFVSTIYVCATPNAGKVMSLGIDPSPAGKFGTGFAYNWYFDTSTVNIWAMGVLRGSVIYNPSSRYAIYYDGVQVQFLVNGLVQYSEARSQGAPLFLCTSFFSGTSVFSNLVYSPLLLPTGFIKEATQEIGSTVFFVNFGTPGNQYFSNIQQLQQFGAQYTFQFSRQSTVVKFLASSIQLSSGTASIWRIDSGTPNPTNTFSNGTIYMNYSFNPIARISTSANYIESTFCGPTVASPDPSVTATMPSLNLSSRNTPVSTILFYNLLGTPIAGTQTTGMYIQGIVSYGTSNFMSTFITNGSSNVQIFNI